jgi:hypothetical protein
VISSRWLCALLMVAAVSPLLTACGTTHSASGTVTTTTVPPSGSTSPPPSRPGSSSAAGTEPVSTFSQTSRAVQYGQDTCRAFESFAATLPGQAEDGPTAVGEIGGMVAEASQALAASSDQRWVKLDADLKALQAVAGSKQWPRSPAAARLPQVQQVSADCQPIGVG